MNFITTLKVMNIKYRGSGLSAPTLRIPGWAGTTTEGKCQPWHMKQFTDAATVGVELIYPFENAMVPEVSPPFTAVNDLFYMLETEIEISTQKDHNLLILPHYRFYTDPDWETPIPVATSIETDWWPNRLKILFRLPPAGFISVFRKGEPYAQAVVVPRSLLRVEEMSEKDIQRNEEAKIHIHNAKNLTTRHWVTSNGFIQDNLYEVIANNSHTKRQLIR